MLLLAISCAAVSAWLWTAPTRHRELPFSARGHPRRTGHGQSPLGRLMESSVARGALCAFGIGSLGQLASGPAGAVVGVLAGLAVSVWIGRLEPPSVVKAREEVDRDLPLAVELLAACSAVGRAPQECLPVVSRAVGGALGARLDEVTARLSLGADPVAEWGRLARDAQLVELGRTMLRSTESGAPLADGLARLAEDRRRERRTQTQLRARNVGVKAAGPLAACFLPAFMLIGVVPTIAGGFQHLFG